MKTVVPTRKTAVPNKTPIEKDAFSVLRRRFPRNLSNSICHVILNSFSENEYFTSVSGRSRWNHATWKPGPTILHVVCDKIRYLITQTASPKISESVRPVCALFGETFIFIQIYRALFAGHVGFPRRVTNMHGGHITIRETSVNEFCKNTRRHLR